MSKLKSFNIDELLNGAFTAADDADPQYLSYVSCLTTKGVVEMEIHHLWSPRGADRFLDLIDRGYYSDIGLFRKNRYILQYGAVQHPQTGARKQFSGMKSIKDDPKTDCFGKCKKGELWDGALAFAGGGRDSRGAQVFWVHHKSTQPLGRELWETPVGNITKGYDIVKHQLYGGYNEAVDQVKIFQGGNDYLKENFPQLDYIVRCEIIDPPSFSFIDYEKTLQRLKGGAAYISGRKEADVPHMFFFAVVGAFILFCGRLLVKSRQRFDKRK